MDAASPSYCIVRYFMEAITAPLSNNTVNFLPFNSTCTGVASSESREISTYLSLSYEGTAHATGEGVIKFCYVSETVYLISCKCFRCAVSSGSRLAFRPTRRARSYHNFTFRWRARRCRVVLMLSWAVGETGVVEGRGLMAS